MESASAHDRGPAPSWWHNLDRIGHDKARPMASRLRRPGGDAWNRPAARALQLVGSQAPCDVGGAPRELGLGPAEKHQLSIGRTRWRPDNPRLRAARLLAPCSSSAAAPGARPGGLPSARPHRRFGRRRGARASLSRKFSRVTFRNQPSHNGPIRQSAAGRHAGFDFRHRSFARSFLRPTGPGYAMTHKRR